MAGPVTQQATWRAARAVYLKALAGAVRDTYGCATLHTASDTVSFETEGRRLELQVETFQLVNCRKGDRCFAWFHPPDQLQRNVIVATVIAGGGVFSPEAAVQAYLRGATSKTAA